MLGSLLAPLRVPERVMEALTEAGRELGLIRSEVTRRPRANRAAGRARERESFLNETVHEMTRELKGRFMRPSPGSRTTSSASPSISTGDVGRYRRFVTCSPVTTTTELGLPEPGGPSRPVSNGSAVLTHHEAALPPGDKVMARQISMSDSRSTRPPRSTEQPPPASPSRLWRSLRGAPLGDRQPLRDIALVVVKAVR